MSLEESMKELAESNRELAKAQTFYAGVIEKFGLKVEKDNGGKPAAAADKAESAAEKKARLKAEAEAAKAAEDDDDGLGGDDDDGDEELTLDQVKASLIALRDATGDKDAALNVMKKFGYKKVPDIQAKDFAAVKKAAEKAMP